MKCPGCRKEIDGKVVVYTTEVATAEGEYIRRRRKCPKCKRRWWTFEVSESDWHILEVARGQLEAATSSRAVQAPEPEPARPKYKF